MKNMKHATTNREESKRLGVTKRTVSKARNGHASAIARIKAKREGMEDDDAVAAIDK